MYQWIPYGEYLYFSAAAGAKTNKGSGTASASASASAWGCDHFAAWDKLFRDKQNITSINSNKGPNAKAAPTLLSTLSTCLRLQLQLWLGHRLQHRPEDSLSPHGTAPHANRVGTSTSRGNCKSQHCDSIAAAPKGFGTQSPPRSSSSSSSCLFRIELNLDMISCPVCFAVFGRLPFKSPRSLRSNWCFTCEYGPRYPRGSHLIRQKGYTKSSGVSL